MNKVDLSESRVVEVHDLAAGFAYMPPTSKGLAFVDKAGACDPLMRDQWQRENPTRYATAYFRWTRTVAGHYTLAGNQQLVLFANGPTQSGAGTGGTVGQTNLTRGDTNAFNEGGAAKQGTRFIGVGAQVQPLAPFIVATDADAIGNAALRQRPAFFDGGTDYGAEAQKLLADTTTVLLQHGQDAACTYDLGPIATWTQASPIDGYKPSLGVPGQFLYLAIPDVSGNKQSGDNLQVTLTVNTGLQVDNNPVNPSVAGFQLITPVRFGLVGFPVCTDGLDGANSGSCGIPGARDESSRRLDKLERIVMDIADMVRGGGGGGDNTPSPPALPQKAGGYPVRRYRP